MQVLMFSFSFFFCAKVLIQLAAEISQTTASLEFLHQFRAQLKLGQLLLYSQQSM